MSLADVRPYFRARLNAMNFTEWKDGFNFENIPSNLIDKSYHMTCGTAVGVKNNQIDQEINFPVTVRIFRKGFRDPASAIDSAIQNGEDVIKECVKPTNSLTQTGIKKIVFDSLLPEGFSSTNDNLVVVTIQFTAFLILKTN